VLKNFSVINISVKNSKSIKDVDKKTVSYYDSYGNNGRDYCDKVLDFLRDDHLSRKGLPLGTQWTTETVQNLPRQKNGYDCGIYCMTFGEYISRGKSVADITSSINDLVMPLYRQMICFELLVQNLYSKSP